jgi:hypothetical protein
MGTERWGWRRRSVGNQASHVFPEHQESTKHHKTDSSKMSVSSQLFLKQAFKITTVAMNIGSSQFNQLPSHFGGLL